jgi:hypothetical protein
VSNVAVARVLVPPTAASPSALRSATVGHRVELVATATGTAPFSYQWFKNGVALPDATQSSLAFEAVQPTDAGNYTAIISNAVGSDTTGPVMLSVVPAGPSSRLSNLSVRTTLAAEQTVIVGLAVADGTREVLVRAVGPALATFGITTALADPRLELFRGQTLLLANDDWPVALENVFAVAGAFGLRTGSKDAAVRQGVDAAVSVQVRGTGAGVVLIEAYDLGQAGASRLVNLSARNRVGSGDNILIAGFTVIGTGTKRLLIRGVGPGLAPFGVGDALADPRLDVFDGSGTRIAENDNWSAVLGADFDAVGAFRLPAGSRDAALLQELSSGAYTVQVRGVNGGTGEAVIEVYEMPGQAGAP